MTQHSSLVSRRSFLGLSSVLLAPAIARADVIRADFPAHEPELVQEVVVDYRKTAGGADEPPVDKPLTAEEAKKLAGAYVYGTVAIANRFEVTANDKNQLSIARAGHFERGLAHQGSYEFVPAGSEHV